MLLFLVLWRWFGSCYHRYQGTILEDGALECAVTGGAASPEYSKLCAWIVSELKLYCKLEENVHATNSETHSLFTQRPQRSANIQSSCSSSSEDKMQCEKLNLVWFQKSCLCLTFLPLTTAGPGEAESFQLEMSGLLTELSCPYAVLITGDITQRFLSKDDCLLLLSETPNTFHPLLFEVALSLNFAVIKFRVFQPPMTNKNYGGTFPSLKYDSICCDCGYLLDLLHHWKFSSV